MSFKATMREALRAAARLGKAYAKAGGRGIPNEDSQLIRLVAGMDYTKRAAMYEAWARAWRAEHFHEKSSSGTWRRANPSALSRTVSALKGKVAALTRIHKIPSPRKNPAEMMSTFSPGQYVEHVNIGWFGRVTRVEGRHAWVVWDGFSTKVADKEPFEVLRHVSRARVLGRRALSRSQSQLAARYAKHLDAQIKARRGNPSSTSKTVAALKHKVAALARIHKLPRATGRRHNPTPYAYNVYLNGKLIDTVFYSSREPVEDVKRSLVNHDYRIVVKAARRKNPDHGSPANVADGGFFDAVEKRKREGYARADARRHEIMKLVDSGHMPGGGGVFTSNMVKALRMHPWANEVDDWQRLREAEIALAYKRSKGARRKSNPSGTRRRREEVDSAAARELELFAGSDRRFSVGSPDPQPRAIRENLMRKFKSGKYNHRLAWKAWMYLVDAAAKAYERELGDGRTRLFNKPTRERVAKAFAYNFAREYKLGNWE